MTVNQAIACNSVPPLAVTTSAHPTAEIEERARVIAAELRAPYVPRNNRNIARMFRETGCSRLLAVMADRLLLRDSGGVEYFFHPNLAILRGNNLKLGWRDIFADAAALQPGDSILDCTVGFAAEATLASYLVGPSGRVVGLESVPELAVVTRQGVRDFPLHPPELKEAMNRVEIVNADHRDFLRQAESRSFDVVYFDPFFEDRLPGSEKSVSPLFTFGNQTPLETNAVIEAMRVAKRRVIIKHPKIEPLPEEIATLVTQNVTGRKSRVDYAVIDVGSIRTQPANQN